MSLLRPPYYLTNKDWYEYKLGVFDLCDVILKPGAPLAAINSYIEDIASENSNDVVIIDPIISPEEKYKQRKEETIAFLKKTGVL